MMKPEIKGIIVNPRGCNASGKTTTAREFISMFPNPQLIDISGSPVTQCSDKVFVLGRYDKKNGGCDGYSGRSEVEGTILRLITAFEPLVIVYEGMLYSTSSKLAQDLDNAFRPRGYYYQGIYLHRPITRIYELLEARNGGADYNAQGIYNTYRAAANAYKNLKRKGIKIVKVEADGIDKSEMGSLIVNVLPESIRSQL